MRSYDSGRYSILKDGNFKLHINRMDRERDHLVIPSNCCDLDEFLALGLVPKDNLFICKYGLNTVETRRKFWDWNGRKIALWYTDKFEIVTDITGYKGRLEFSNNFNITKLPNMDRPYIDEFYESDINSIIRAKKTTVLNQCQKDYILETNPEIAADKIEVNQLVISDAYFKAVGTACFPGFQFQEGDIFFPFRLSDPAYKFEEVMHEYSDRRIVVTDPNHTLNKFLEDCIHAPNIVDIWPNKKQYYGLLAQKPTIVYNEDPSKVFHPGLADFIYFGCDIISPYRIPTLEEVLIK